MLSTLARGLLGDVNKDKDDNSSIIVKVYPVWGFAEFPAPGDTKKHTLPILIDADLVNEPSSSEEVKRDNKQLIEKNSKDFWMPDRFCKVCYGCEEAFTMYRRRHHCRMCGQIFCNTCSSFYIDGNLFNHQSLVRSCKLCYNQLYEQNERENRLAKRKLLDSNETENSVRNSARQNMEFSKSNERADADSVNRISNLQNRASMHLIAIINQLVNDITIISEESVKSIWKEIILSLVREVVSTVDPDVKNGDSLDIRDYVKIKVIPGGTRDESIYIDGLLFRKNVSHKKMAVDGNKTHPTILLLTGGIEFQRTDNKLSSMDTLIEQEDKYMEILVDKIMSLKPDIILVGKAVARRAQELLCQHKVVVMQNVKPHLLERVARMTNAMLLPSTDHMIKQFGQECMGTCGQFTLKVVLDDPEKALLAQKRRSLPSRILRGSTYAYFQGCPPEKGCSIRLRGDSRAVLAEIKRVLRFAIVIAYHLRLEVSYYSDLCANLPDTVDSELYDTSDSDDEICDETLQNVIEENDDENKVKNPLSVMQRSQRFLLSTSLDIDYSLPYTKELIGTQNFGNIKNNITKLSIEDHQTLLFTSIFMVDGPYGTPIQKTPAELKAIKYYSNQDVALGKFIIDSCFQLYRNQKENKTLDQKLSFVHRQGRIDISVHKANSDVLSEEHIRDPLKSLPIYMSSFCKECNKSVTSMTLLSEETWKISFGKFLEIMFYNRSAKCGVSGCNHSIRDSHILTFTCEGHKADFEFIPIHSFSLHVRDGMVFPQEFHQEHSFSYMNNLPYKHEALMNDFRLAIVVLEKEIREVLATRPDELALAMADVLMIESELQSTAQKFYEDLLQIYQFLPIALRDLDQENSLVTLLLHNYSRNDPSLVKKYANFNKNKSVTITKESTPQVINKEHDFLSFQSPVSSVEKDAALENITVTIDCSRESFSSDISRSGKHGLEELQKAYASPVNSPSTIEVTSEIFIESKNSELEVASRFPHHLMRDTYLKASKWNSRIDTIYKFLESVRHILLQQQQQQLQQMQAAQSLNAQSNLNYDIDYNNNKVNNNNDLLYEKGNDYIQSPSLVSLSDQPNIFTVDMVPNNLQITSLSQALEINKKTYEKPVDKMGRITKALKGFLGGASKEVPIEDQSKFFVPLGDFGVGRYGLKPGLKGIVIPVHEDQYAAIIAYSLASEEYNTELQLHLDEDSSLPINTGMYTTDKYDQDDNDDIFPKNGPNKDHIKKNKSKYHNNTHDDEDLDDVDDHEHDMQVDISHLDVLEVERAFGKNSNRDDHSIINSNNVKFSIFPEDDDIFHHDNKNSNNSIKNEFPSFGTSLKSKNEKQMTSQYKSYIRHRFDDYDEKNNIICRFQCQIYWAKQFEAVRTCYFKESDNENFIRSLSMSNKWITQGGKSGASFSKTLDDRLIIKVIPQVELRMFIEFAPAYFEYLAKAYYHNLPTVLSKILGVYTIRYHNKETGKKVREHVVVMENLFYQRNISRSFDLKGTSRVRNVKVTSDERGDDFDTSVQKRRTLRRKQKSKNNQQIDEVNNNNSIEGLDDEYVDKKNRQVLLDDNLMELTHGKPFPLKHKARHFFQKAVQNDTLFLSIVNVVDYSILVGFDETSHEVTVGIIDYMRQYDIVKRMETMVKSSGGVLTGQAEPTIIQPPQYKKRFTLAMERYFMTVPDKWIPHES